MAIKNKFYKSIYVKGVKLVIVDLDKSQGTYVASSTNEGQKEQALIRRRTFCAASGQSLDLLSHMSVCRKHLSLSRSTQNKKNQSLSIKI